jgi:hypothetical protein
LLALKNLLKLFRVPLRQGIFTVLRASGFSLETSLDTLNVCPNLLKASLTAALKTLRGIPALWAMADMRVISCILCMFFIGRVKTRNNKDRVAAMRYDDGQSDVQCVYTGLAISLV